MTLVEFCGHVLTPGETFGKFIDLLWNLADRLILVEFCGHLLISDGILWKSIDCSWNCMEIVFASPFPPRPILNALFYIIFGPQGHQKMVEEVIWCRTH